MEDFGKYIQYDDEDQLGEALPSIKKFFMDGLKDAIRSLGGDPNILLVGYSCVIIRRQKGLGNGLLDVIYIEEKDNKKFRFRLEVAIHLRLAQPKHSTKMLPTHEMHMMAKEFREKFLVSQIVECYGDRQVTIVRDKDNIRVVENEDEKLNNTRFSLGNVTVLSWGKVISAPGFHTMNQIFPVGFKCIRQEHDTLLNRIVDCYCEIDSVTEKHVNFDGNVVDVLSPLFRVTLAWQLDSGKTAIRVYEGKSPQQAWQSAMLETLGQQAHHMKEVSDGPNFLLISLEDAKKANEEAEEDSELNMLVEQEVDDFDEEELALRAEIRDQRRGYFRALRQEQSLGLHAAVKPRLTLDTVDHFADESLMRLIEGMDGVENCQNYIFTDARDKDTRRKLFMCKAFNRLFNKVKGFNKIIPKDAQSRKKVKGPKEKVVKRAPGTRKPGPGVGRGRGSKIALMTKQQQEIFEQSIEQKNQMRKKVKDIDRKVKEIKDNVKAFIKKRRDEAKLRVEINCHREEEDRKKKEIALNITKNSKNITAANDANIKQLMLIPIPEPSNGSVCLDGEVVSNALELWNFLQTFPHRIRMKDPPSVDKFLLDIKNVDYDYKILQAGIRLSTMGLSELMDRSKPSIRSSDSLESLNDIGIILCMQQEKEYRKCVGMDLLELPKDDGDIPINRFTWKEICRILLLGAACKDLGMTDGDLATYMKGGKGNSLSPEGMDIKTVRILRKRILFHTLELREENQEALYGFSAGLCVRVPCPSSYREKNLGSTTWKKFLASLANIPDDKAWMIYDLIDSAIKICKCMDDQYVQEMATKLEACLVAPIFSFDDGSKSKLNALKLLDAFQLEENKAERESLDGDNQKMDVEKSLKKIDTIPFMNSTEIKEDCYPPSSPFHLWQLQKDSQLRHAIVEVDATEMDIEPDDDLEKDQDEDENMATTNSTTKTEESLLSEEKEFEIAENLSVASRRCYLVIRDLMHNPIAYSFCNPVKKQDAPLYSKTIANRLCFSDIKKHLLNGGYENAICNFYTDVNLVFENALAFNPDFSQITQHATKLISIFERMFMEFVLYVDSPLPCMDACHICRSMDDPVIFSSNGAKCERCEGLYHLHCLDPPPINPRQEWYCPACIEQKGVATVHPNNTAKVFHPENPNLYGEVVGMEQIKQTIRFVIEFGTCREMWSGNKVRKYYVTQNDQNSMDIDESLKVGTRGVPILPPGYNYDDYDKVCGLARGYNAWAASHYMIPSYISPQYSLEAFNKKLHNPFFENCCDAVAALGHLVDPNDLGAKEWSTILHAIMKRALTVPHISGEITKLELEVEVATNANFNAIQDGDITSFDSLVRKPSKYIEEEYHDDDETEDEEPDTKIKVVARGRPKKQDPAPITTNKPPNKKIASNVDIKKDDNYDKERKVNNTDNISTESESIDSGDDSSEDEFDVESEVKDIRSTNNYAQWDTRLLSRKRGREEALITQHAVFDLIVDPDLIEDLKKDKNSPIFDSVVKACAVKPNDGLDADDWCNSWNKKMEHFATNFIEDMKHPKLCKFCGYDEHYLAHPLVMAHTWTEWDNDRHDEKVAEENKMWLPYDSEDADLEKKECNLQTRRALRPGSVVAHEICADHMNYMRSVYCDRHGLHDYRNQFEVISGAGRGKSTPLGKDREGRFYWILAGLHGIFVSSNPKSQQMKKTYANKFLEGAEKFLTNSADDRKKSVIWRMYDNDYEIGKLTKWLDDVFPEERQLKKVIDWLFPNCLNATKDSPKIFTRSLSSPTTAEDNGTNNDDDDIFDDDDDDFNPKQNNQKRVIDDNDEDDKVDDSNDDKDDADDETKSIDDDDDDDEEWDDGPKSKRSRNEKERTKSNRCEKIRLKKETDHHTDTKYRIDQRIFVETKPSNILWDAKILEIRMLDNIETVYKVRFEKWGPAYDRWISETSIKPNKQIFTDGKSKTRQKFSREKYAEEHTDNIPECLMSLRAIEYLEAEYRESIRETLKLSFSDTSTTDMEYVRYALLLVEAALPCGSLEISDDKWGDEFAVSWREAVIAASDATSLMGCVIMLEYCIKGTWTTTIGNKVLSCLPTRTQALKTATVSQCALRLWLVDRALRYDKFITPEEKANKSKNKKKK